MASFHRSSILRSVSLWLLFLLPLSSSQATWSASCKAKHVRETENVSSEAIDEIEEQLIANRFTVNRSIDQYLRMLGSRFGVALDLWGSSEGKRRWVDMGSGYGSALKQARGRYGGENFDQVAVSFRFPEGAKYALEEQGVKCVEGPIEDADAAAFGKVNLITDLYGAFSYSPNFHDLLSKYHQILEEGGDLFIVAVQPITREEKHAMGYRYDPEYGTGYRVLTATGEEIGLKGLFKKIEGFELLDIERFHAPTATEMYSEFRLHLRKTNEPLRIPQMKLTRIAKAPPTLLEWTLLGE